jgi:hypothetical protein
MRYFIVCFILILSGFTARSQSFDYSVSTDSTTWSELSSQTILNTSNSPWAVFYKIPIGFTFNYMGGSFDSLRIETNGYFVFDSDGHYTFTAFHFFVDKTDSLSNHSIIGYELSGTNGNRVLKIQFKNVGQTNTYDEFVTYQVWICEAGNKVELHMGPSTYWPDPLAPVTDTDQYILVGLLNQNMDTEISGYLIYGSVLQPSVTSISPASEFVYLQTVPKPGFRYSFQAVIH